MSPITLSALLALSSAAVGCVPPHQAPPPAASAAASATTSTTAATPPHGNDERHVYRFDFVLAASDGTTPASSTSFTLTLLELEKGEMLVGKNVPLTAVAPAAAGAAPASGPSVATPSSPRQDVGMKVVATFRTAGDDVILEVNTEMSAFEPPSSIRKVVSKGNAIASSGKSALVTTLESDSKRYQLTVTPTKLR
jgi:hypothetical protein